MMTQESAALSPTEGEISPSASADAVNRLVPSYVCKFSCKKMKNPALGWYVIDCSVIAVSEGFDKVFEGEIGWFE